MSLGGIFSDDKNNLLGKANKVYAPSCTGDAWQGGEGGLYNEVGKWGYRFRGQPTWFSLMKDLTVKHGLGQHPGGEYVVFGGISSGARGAMTLLDRINNAVEIVIPPKKPIKVLGFLDSPFVRTDIQNIDGTDNEYVRRIKQANADGILTPSELFSECKS